MTRTLAATLLAALCRMAPRPGIPRLAIPRLAIPRLAIPRLAIPRLAIPGLAIAGLAAPSLAAPSLAAPSLAAPVLAASAADTPMTFHSEKVELPTGDRIFPGGDKADAINNNCVTCHSAGMVLNQPALTRAEWSSEVHKMVNVYKAPVAPEDVDAIISYLAETKGHP